MAPKTPKSAADDQNPLANFQWHGLAFRATLTTLTHPIEYAKVLIQIGHEPVAPRHTKTFFGKPALALPSVFQYIGYIKKRDGFFGLYKGFAPKLVSSPKFLIFLTEIIVFKDLNVLSQPLKFIVRLEFLMRGVFQNVKAHSPKCNIFNRWERTDDILIRLGWQYVTFPEWAIGNLRSTLPLDGRFSIIESSTGHF